MNMYFLQCAQRIHWTRGSRDRNERYKASVWERNEGEAGTRIL